MPPLGPYPHPLLCGQDGNTPINASIKTIKSIVPKVILFSQVDSGYATLLLAIQIQHTGEVSDNLCDDERFDCANW